MESLFSSDNKIFNFVGKCIDLIKLNMLWMLFSVPVITIGASTCALHDLTSGMAAGEDGYIFRPFLQTFRKKFSQATRIWIPFLAAGIALAVDFCFWMQISGTVASVMKGLVISAGAVYLFLLVYLFPLIVRMETPWKVTLRNAALLAFKYLPRTLYMVLWILIAYFAGKIWALGLWVVFFAGGSGVALIHSYCLNRIFEKELGKQENIE